MTDQLSKQLTGFRKNHGEKIILHNAVSDFSVGNVEENIRWRKIYLYNIQGSVKDLWPLIC